MEENTQTDRNSQPINIDVKRIIYRAIQYWYVVVLTLGIALLITFFKTRYAVKIFPVTASILIKEQEQTSQGKLLYNNPLVSGFRNYLNEPYIIRSYPIVQRNLEDLNFGSSFFKEGNVLTTELYDIPVKGKVLDDGGQAVRKFYFTVLNNHKYQLSPDGDEIQISKQPVVFAFGDTILFDGLSILFEKKKNFSVKEYENAVLVFSYTRPALLTGDYVSRLRVSWAEEGSGVINLSLDGSNPAKEIDFLNGLIYQYQQNDLDKKNVAASNTIDFITKQLTNISDSLQDVERKLEQFKDQNVMTDLSIEAQRLYGKLEVLEVQKVELIIRNNYFQYLSGYIQQSENLDQIILPTSLGISDGILTEMVSMMVDLQLQLKMNTKLENPLVSDSRRKINEIKRDIVESMNNLKATDKIKLDYLAKQIKDIENQLNYLPLAERKLVSIQRQYSLLESLYIFLLQKRAEAAISKASNTTDIDIVNPPMQVGGPIYPKPTTNYLIAIIIGLGLPAMLFVLLEVFNTKVQSKEDVEKLSTIPFIGGVGHKRANNNLEVLTAPKSSIAESFRALRSNLNYFVDQQEKSVFLITSSISGEGKTFTSINLASVFALSGKRTLIVGADMRKPKLFSDFNLTNETGLSTYLAGITHFESTVQKTDHDCLDLISGGPVPPNPSELLLTKRMDDFIAEAKKRYDYVIIDTPPMAIVTDAFVLAGYADHILFLVRQNYTPKGLIRTVQDFYTSGKLKNISIVLNDIYRSGPGYGYGYGYAYGYGYHYGSKNKNGYGYYEDQPS